MLAQWVAARAEVVDIAYLAVDGADNDEGRLLAYLAAALGRLEIATGPEVEVVSTSQWIDHVLPSVVAELADRDRPMAVVLDDYHQITNPEVHTVARALIDYLPANGHVVMAGRADPPLPLARLRAQREVEDIRAHDLGLDRDETANVLATSYGIELAQPVVDALHQKTEGWAAGICLAGLTLAAAPDVSAAAVELTGRERHVAAFFNEEVLANLDPELVEFLLETSVLDSFSGGGFGAIEFGDFEDDPFDFICEDVDRDDL